MAAPPQLNGAHFRITVLEQDGFLDASTSVVENGHNQQPTTTFSGYCIDMLQAISRPDRGNFTYDLLRPSGYGSLCQPRAVPGVDAPYQAQYYGQYNCGQADVSDLPITNYSTDFYLGMYYITTQRQEVNQFSIPFAPPVTGRPTMFGTAVRIRDIGHLVEQQQAGLQKPVCMNRGSGTIPFLQAAFPGIQLRQVVGPTANHYRAFLTGECDVFIKDHPFATRFVLERSRHGQCYDNKGMPFGIIGEPLQFGPGQYGIGIRNDLEPHVVRTVNYWLNALMTCAPADPDSVCPNHVGSLASLYTESGGDGTECGYDPWPPEPSGHETVSPGAIAGMVIGSVSLVAILVSLVAAHRLRMQRHRIRHRFVQQIARNICIGPSPGTIPPDKLAEQVQHIGSSNANGIIQKDDLLTWMSDVKMNFISQKDFDALWAAMDIDGSGEVNAVEFFVFLSSCGPQFEQVYHAERNMPKLERLKLAARRLSNIHAVGEEGVRRIEHQLDRSGRGNVNTNQSSDRSGAFSDGPSSKEAFEQVRQQMGLRGWATKSIMRSAGCTKKKSSSSTRTITNSGRSTTRGPDDSQRKSDKSHSSEAVGVLSSTTSGRIECPHNDNDDSQRKSDKSHSSQAVGVSFEEEEDSSA